MTTVVVTISDFRYHVIPDRVTLPGAVLGLLLAAVGGNEPGPIHSVLGTAAGVTLFWLLAFIGKLLPKRDAMGGGDIKLAAMLGVFLGWVGLFEAVFLAAVAALVFVIARAMIRQVPLTKPVPLGPFLMYAEVLIYTWGPRWQSFFLLIVEVSGRPTNQFRFRFQDLLSYNNHISY